MPWLAIPFEMDDLRKELASTFDVQGIPSLVLVDAEDSVITDEARQEICDDPSGKVLLILKAKIFVTSAKIYANLVQFLNLKTSTKKETLQLFFNLFNMPDFNRSNIVTLSTLWTHLEIKSFAHLAYNYGS